MENKDIVNENVVNEDVNKNDIEKKKLTKKEIAKKVAFEVLDYLKIIVFAIVIATLISTQVFTFSQVQQQSMEKTLIANDAIVIDKLSYHFTEPKYGDIVVMLKGDDVDMSFFAKIKRLYTDMINKFQKKDNMDRLVKRVIAVAGEEVDFRDGVVYINGEPLDEPYVTSPTYPTIIEVPFVVPEGQVFVMGDNREVSEDGRTFGCIDIEQIEGKAVFRILPLSKFGTID